MTPFEGLSALIRALFSLCALLLCLMNTGSALLAAVKKRFRYTVLSLLLFLPAYFLWQVIFDFSLSVKAGNAVALTVWAVRLPWILWLLPFALLAAASVPLFISIVRYDKNYLTPGAVKLYLDKIPCGVCCWRENGRVLLSNDCMNELCAALTGGPLLNGNHFRDALPDGIRTVNGKVWRFSSRQMLCGGERLFEMIASDVTDEYTRTQALEKDRVELVALNGKLKEYYLNIDDAVRRQEILQAKVNIHDEMNKLMLSTAAASGNEEELDRIFELWEQNALLLCMQAEETTAGKAEESMEKLADALHIELLRKGTPPAWLTEKQRDLFCSAACEAMVNAVKHAKAKRLTVSVKESEDSVVFVFSNDGAAPLGPVRFTGGLSNLSLLAEKQGTVLEAKTDGDIFRLLLTFRKYQPYG